MVILTVGAFWQADYEWEAHVPYALEYGVEQSIVDAIKAGEPTIPGTETEIKIYKATREMLEARRLSPEKYEGLVRLLGEQTVIDLVALISSYAFVSLTINVFGVTPNRT
ncbi:hypothetical protein CDEF62S_01549 [Castellaniella defragrans]